MVKMKKIYCMKYNNYRRFKNPEISNILGKTLVLSIIWGDCVSADQEKF